MTQKKIKTSTLTHNLQCHLAFVGMMGSGKSTIGRMIAKHLQLPFYDIDKQIEQNEESTISNIFLNHGETYFRQIEAQTVMDVIALRAHVISLGGGAFETPQTRKILKKHAITIWLNVPFEVLWKRVSKKQHRPLLQVSDPKTKLHALFKQRLANYQKADIHFSTFESSKKICCQKILQTVETYLQQNKR
ncbi:MAG: shikimate kinase [Pseudomonadota bacterium]